MLGACRLTIVLGACRRQSARERPIKPIKNTLLRKWTFRGSQKGKRCFHAFRSAFMLGRRVRLKIAQTVIQHAVVFSRGAPPRTKKHKRRKRRKNQAGRGGFPLLSPKSYAQKAPSTQRLRPHERRQHRLAGPKRVGVQIRAVQMLIEAGSIWQKNVIFSRVHPKASWQSELAQLAPEFEAYIRGTQKFSHLPGLHAILRTSMSGVASPNMAAYLREAST